MARIGVFALNISPRSGGVHGLVTGMMAHAAKSRHQYLYVTEEGSIPGPLPANVRLVTRSKRRRLAVQCLVNAPGAHRFLARRAAATTLTAAAAGVPKSLFESVDAWLWPHCFAPVPNLGPTAVICHDLIHRRHPECFGRSALARRARSERMLPACASILCPSHTTLGDLTAAYPELEGKGRAFQSAPVELIAAEECEQELRDLRERFGGKPFFLYVAVDWPHKNHALLLGAAAEFRRRYARDARIVFAGQRRGGRLAEQIRAAGLGDAVTDLGRVSRPMLGALYRSAAALLFPSWCEGFGIPLVEAMQYRLPIVASDRSCIPEVCGDAAVLLPADSPGAWAEQMARLETEAAYRAALAERAGERGRRFGWDRTWTDLDEAFSLAASESVPHRPPTSGAERSIREPAASVASPS